MLRISQKYLCTNKGSSDRFHPYRNIIKSTIQSHRSIVLILCRYYKTANFNSRNYYELLGVERTATQKEIKKAFYKLSKEYHPDSNSADQSLHEKFVKINEAFSVLSKQSTRSTYDQSLNSISRPPYQSYSRQPSPNWSNINFASRSTYQRRTNTNESTWNIPHYDKAFYDMLRRKMEHDRQRSGTYSNYYTSPHSVPNTYFASVSVIIIVIALGMFIHALQWRTMHFSDAQYNADPRTRHYRAYREWRRLNALKDAESTPIQREFSSSSTEEK
ncbi:unnamed protein product [Rotaria sordida]|uniref:J domain-containing protein n=1 Tax=Rotaria sordida TaxID=392033 RepID=A0A819SGF0_9BILA|nr:unnamed protein product [Rotaria sordida]CAF4061188.1 unnamed protein product [Rotaria sordida]